MKHLLFILAFTASLPALADSPLTSTDFYRAYQKSCAPAFCRLLEEASTSHRLNSAMNEFLTDDRQPLAERAALVNALGWQTNGRPLAPRFKKFLLARGISPSGSLLLLQGYMAALDGYLSHPKAGLAAIVKAERLLPGHATVVILRALVEAQIAMDEKPVSWRAGDGGYSPEEAWQDIWPLYRNALARAEGMEEGLSPEALRIVTDYMILYKPYAR